MVECLDGSIIKFARSGIGNDVRHHAPDLDTFILIIRQGADVLRPVQLL